MLTDQELARAIADHAPDVKINHPTAMELAVMLYIGDGCPHIAEIAAGLGVSVGTASPVVSSLVARGWLWRVRDRFDHRRRLVSRTPKGVVAMRRTRAWKRGADADD